MSKVVGSLKAILGLDKSKYDAGLKDAQKQVNAFGAFAKRALGVLAGLFAVSKIFAWGKATVASYNAAAEAEQKLATIMKARMGLGKEAAADLIRQAAAYQKIGVVADDVQVAGLQQLATFANQKESLESLLPAMNNLLAQQKGYKATSEDAVTIARLMGKALNGQVEALTRAGIQISDSQKNALKTGNEFERAAALAGIINSKVGQMNQQLGQSDRGIIQKWVNTFDDLKEAIGERILPVLARFAQAGTSMVESILKQSNALIKEKTELNLLVGVITDELTLQKDRKRLIDELNGKYPEFLKNLNAEKVTNQELLTRLEDINKEYEKRISLAIKEELIAGKVKKLTRLYKDQYDAQIELEKLQKEQSDLISSTQDKSSDAYKADLKFYKDLIKNRENLIRKRQEERAAIDEEIEGVMKLVDAERKALEVTGGGGGVATPFDAEAFKDELKVAKEEFAAYDKLIMAGYEDEARAQYSHLQEMGGDWRTYLENQLILYRNNLEARKLLFQEYVESGATRTSAITPFKATPLSFIAPKTQITAGPGTVNLSGMDKAFAEGTLDAENFTHKMVDMGGIIPNIFDGMSNSIADALGSTENTFDAFTKFFGDFIKSMIIKLTAATIAAAAFAAVMTLVTGGTSLAAGGAGSGLFKSLFKQGFKGFFGMQEGGAVPPGYPNDSFPALLSSGETVMTSRQMTHLRNTSPVIIRPKVIGLRGRELKILIERENDFYSNIGT